MKDYTDIILVLDRSGSMNSVRSDTIGGVNRFVEDQKKVPGEARYSLFQFNDQLERPAVVAEEIAKVKPLTEATYVPDGNTCLYGAIGCAIQEMGKRFQGMPEEDRPSKVVFVIVTDGLENSSQIHEWSRPHTAESIRADIERQSNIYKWHFVYIGADQDAIFQARRIAIVGANAINYSKNREGSEKLYKGLSKNVSDLRCAVTSSMSWGDDQRKEQADAQGV